MPRHRHSLPLIACIALTMPAFAAENSFDGTYTGERVLTEGEPGTCVTEEPVSIDVRGEQLLVTNTAVKDHAVAFFPRADGSFGELSATLGGNVVVIRGRIGVGVLDADVISAHCTHHWHLEKQH